MTYFLLASAVTRHTARDKIKFLRFFIQSERGLQSKLYSSRPEFAIDEDASLTIDKNTSLTNSNYKNNSRIDESHDFPSIIIYSLKNNRNV